MHLCSFVLQRALHCAACEAEDEELEPFVRALRH